MAKKIIENTGDLDDIIGEEFSNLTDISKVDTKVKLWYDWGVYAINYISSKNLFHGVPAGRITSVKGLSGVGKSMFLANVCKDPKIDKVIAIGSEGGGLSAELFEFTGVPLEKVRLTSYNTFSSYRMSKKTGVYEEIADSKMPEKKETDEYVYYEGVTRFVKRFVNIVEIKKITANIVILIDSLANFKSVRELNGTCYTPDTIINTLDGNKFIKDITTNDKVLTHLGSYERVLDTPVYEDKKEIIEIETVENDVIKLTPNHPLLVLRNETLQWVRADSLLTTDKLQKIL